MKTSINIFGKPYFLWIKGIRDQETKEYPDILQQWDDGKVSCMAWHITQEDEFGADRVAFEDNQLVLKDREEPGSAFGYVWFSKEGMKGRNGFEHGLVGMRYGQESSKESVFFNASSLEFSWRLAVSKRMVNWIQWKSSQMRAPAPMQTSTLVEKPQLFKTKIEKLNFREKMQRYLRRPTTKVYEAIAEEFGMFGLERQEDIIEKLRNAPVSKQEHIAELIEEFMATCQQCTSDDARNKAEETLPAGL